MCDALRREGAHAAHAACVAALGPGLTAGDAFHAAVSHRALGDVASSTDWYRRAIGLRVDPLFAEAYLHGAYVLAEAGRQAEAIESYRAGMRLREWPAKTAAAAHNNLGVLLRGTGQLAEALVSFEEAVRARPDLPEAAENLRGARAAFNGEESFSGLLTEGNRRFADASAGLTPGGFDAAAELYRRATLLRDPRVDGSAYVGLGAALHGARRVEEALAVLRRGISVVLPGSICSTLAPRHRFSSFRAHAHRQLGLTPGNPAGG